MLKDLANRWTDMILLSGSKGEEVGTKGVKYSMGGGPSIYI